jgi:hypothetical protein
MIFLKFGVCIAVNVKLMVLMMLCILVNRYGHSGGVCLQSLMAWHAIAEDCNL